MAGTAATAICIALRSSTANYAQVAWKIVATTGLPIKKEVGEVQVKEEE